MMVFLKELILLLFLLKKSLSNLEQEVAKLQKNDFESFLRLQQIVME
jgi:hypothetical protein